MVEIEVRDSPIHGKGVFALQSVSPGTLIGVYEGRIVTEKMDSPFVLWLEDEEGRWFGIEGDGPLRYMNHDGDEPNVVAGVDSPFIFCARPIQAGEEITICYSEDWEPPEKD